MIRKQEETPSYKAPAVQKAFLILRAIATSPEALGVSELAKLLRFSKSTTFGLTQALAKEGALKQTAGKKKFLLGPEIFELALRDWNYLKMSQKAQPILNELRDNIKETVFLGVMSQGKALILATAESTEPVKISAPRGTVIPLLSSAVGKAILSQFSDDQVRERIDTFGLKPFTPKAITDVDTYIAELAEVRKKGYAFDDEEYMTGVKAVGTSLKNARGLPMAIWVVGFASSMTGVKIPLIAKQIMTSAEKIK